MNNILTKIIAHKKIEVQRLLNRSDLVNVDHRISTKSFKRSLHKNHLAIIAEIKRKSPSRGKLSSITSPTRLAQQYQRGGADAISVLTDEKYFFGSGDDLTKVAALLADTTIPVLRKDFIIHQVQIDESILLGADAVLLIVAVLNSRLKPLLQYAKLKNIEALVEVHTADELKIALDASAEIIGINNRDLNNFQIDINHSIDLVSLIPKGIIKVSESGINTAEQAQLLYKTGFEAILVGEALVVASSPAVAMQKIRGTK